MSVALPCPHFFGPPGGALFGQFHAAAPEAAPSGHALLICPPFGREDISAHASLVSLAQQAARAGVPALRFDYAGCGNSEGDETEPDRLEAWTRSVGLAIDRLKELTGVERVVVLGLRLGALLAHLASETRDDVTALIAVAPVISGRAFVRELRALQMTGGTAPAAAGLEAGGFAIDDATREALAGIDLLKRTQRAAPRVLIVDRDDMPPNPKWADCLRELGVQVEQQTQPGYAAMMADPHFALPPQALIASVVNWLQALPAEPPRSVATLPPGDTPRKLDGVRETAVWIGAQPALFGIVSEPPAGHSRGAGDAVLLLNAGATRLIGPNRMMVPLARRWAAQGRTVLRLDIAGLGDSPPATGQPGNVVYSPHALDDVAAAIDWLRQRTGCERVQLVGLCSGAYHAFRAAAAGLPVASAVMINPLTFFWKEGMSLDPAAPQQDFQVASEVMRHRRSIWQLGTWARLLRGEVGLQRLAEVLRQWSGWTIKKLGQTSARALGMKLGDDLGAELSSMARHGVRQHYIFADTDPGLELLRAQGGAVVQQLQARGLLTIDCVAHADHTFTSIAPRRHMLDILSARVEGPP